MVNTLLFLLLMSGIFLLGFFGNIFFKKTKISDILILIFVGLLLGPIFHLIPQSIIILLKSFTPIFAAIALIILLFDGGLCLNFNKVVNEIKNSFIFTILIFIFTAGLSGLVLHYVFGVEWIFGFLAGAIIGGTSSAIVIPLVNRSSATEKTKIILTLESAMTDVFCVVATITIAGLIVSQSINATNIAQGIFSAFAIATVIGLVGGLIWIKVLRDYTEAKDFDYLLTLAFLFILYVLTEYLNGNGAFCALIFGLILGNASTILKIFKMKEFTMEKSMSHFQTEISLLIKTFFFVYLGIIIDLTIINIDIILISLGLIVVLLVVRIIVSKLIFSKTLNNADQDIISALHARGLAAAVLATYPLTVGIVNDFTQKLVAVVFLVILITNITTTIYLFIVEKGIAKEFKNKANNLVK
jgi:potassium/hydrogen antiporter